MRRWFLALTLLFAACPLRVTLTAAEIERELSRSFPVTREYSVLSVELSNPKVVLKPGSDRIGLKLDATAGVAILKARGTVSVEGRLRYEAEPRLFYLDDPQVVALQLPGLPETQQQQVLDTINVAVRAALPTVPIHRLEQGNGKYFLRAVKVEDGRVIAELGL
ncbi:MAG: DUF1439 domain-containing protein [Myxococcales bacterium]|nr:DUF1439 domain-containing protein [Myxococcales bacterium]